MTTILLFLLALLLACLAMQAWLRARRRRRKRASLALHHKFDRMKADWNQIEREIAREQHAYRKALRQWQAAPQSPKPAKTMALTKEIAMARASEPAKSTSKQKLQPPRQDPPSSEKRPDAEVPNSQAPSKTSPTPQKPSKAPSSKTSIQLDHAILTPQTKPNDATGSIPQTSVPQTSMATPPRRFLFQSRLFQARLFQASLVKLRAALVLPWKWLSPIFQPLSNWITRKSPDSRADGSPQAAPKNKLAA